MKRHYSGDGNIKDYLKGFSGTGRIDPSFQGYDAFKELWALGVMEPHIAAIRLYFNNRSDEHYVVVSSEYMAGADLKKHSGKPGLHSIEETLSDTDASYWEASDLDPKAFRD
jgi:hypothetical protein